MSAKTEVALTALHKGAMAMTRSHSDTANLDKPKEEQFAPYRECAAPFAFVDGAGRGP